MIAEKLNEIRDAILAYNPFFAQGFTTFAHEVREVFPRDSFGPYFYMSLPDNLPINNLGLDASAAHGRIKTPVKVVAVMADADPYILAERLFAAIARQNIRVSAIGLNPEKIVKDEAGEEALSSLKNNTIVSVTFVLQVDLIAQQSKCLPSPCCS